MGKLTTHVLDTMNGSAAAGMAVTLYRMDDDAMERLCTVQLNDDGRPDAPLLEGEALQPGRYRLLFSVAGYFMSFGAALPAPPFLGEVPVDFGVADASAHYHVPLLVSPWSYSTYRGS
jgi:5-hydroxyisourate hydrolase